MCNKKGSLGKENKGGKEEERFDEGEKGGKRRIRRQNGRKQKWIRKKIKIKKVCICEPLVHGDSLWCQAATHPTFVAVCLKKCVEKSALYFKTVFSLYA